MKRFLVLFVLLILALAPAATALNFIVPEKHVLVGAPGTGWTFRLIADGHPTLESDFNAAPTCTIGPSPRVHVEPSGSEKVDEWGSKLCFTDPFIAANLGAVPATLFSEATYAPTGMRVSFPEATVPVEYDKFHRLGGAINDGSDETALLFVNDGARAGTITLVIYGNERAGGGLKEIGREYVTIVAHGFVRWPMQTKVRAGSVVVTLGKMTAAGIGCGDCNTPTSAPDGPVWGWWSVGPPAGLAAPRTGTLQPYTPGS